MPARPAPPDLGAQLAGTPLAIMLDIDGTLCDIVPHFDQVSFPEATRAVLRRLARLPDVAVALITGRSVEDALRIAAVEGAYVHGNHGIEAAHPSGRVEIDAVALDARDAVRRAAAALDPVVAAVPGAALEDKTYTLSVHSRNAAPGAEPALRAAVTAVAARHGLRVTEGNRLLEVRPAGAATKGSAVLRLARELGADRPGAALLFAGDDLTDEDAFVALRDAVPHAVTVHVGGRVPDSAARYTLPDTGAVRALLEEVAAARVGDRRP